MRRSTFSKGDVNLCYTMPTLEEVKARLAAEQKDPDKKKEMSPKQEEVVQAVIDGKNLFFTGLCFVLCVLLVITFQISYAILGPAGSGKSFLIHVLTKHCLPQPPLTAICAATGLAAVNIGGTSLATS